MASNSSGKLNPSQTYTLGDYEFRLVVTKLEDEHITSVQCHASYDGTNKQTGKDIDGTNVTVDSWKVEAEDKTATIYATMHKSPIIIDTTPVNKPFPKDTTYHIETFNVESTYTAVSGTVFFTAYKRAANACFYIIGGTVGSSYTDGSQVHTFTEQSPYYTYKGKRVCYGFGSTSYLYNISKISPLCNNGEYTRYALENECKRIAWYMVYGDEDGKEFEQLIARFEIDIADAGGGTWDDPGSTGEPSKTLHITVTGALSGRHNDPLNDASYHYYPSEREQAEIYGSGGVGGNGGAGGAGASTVIAYQFGTDKAGSTDVTAIAKRHGYGSGGGKGGKGGDGCILVYY